MLSLSIIMWSSRYTLRIAAAGISTNHHSILEIVVCLRSFHWLVVLFHTHDNDLMAPISDLLASGNNCNGEFRELQFFWRETLNLRRIILCCLCITIFTNPLPEDAAVFFALASFFLTPSFFWAARFRLCLSWRKNWSCLHRHLAAATTLQKLVNGIYHTS